MRNPTSRSRPLLLVSEPRRCRSERTHSSGMEAVCAKPLSGLIRAWGPSSTINAASDRLPGNLSHPESSACTLHSATAHSCIHARPGVSLAAIKIICHRLQPITWSSGSSSGYFLAPLRQDDVRGHPQGTPPHPSSSSSSRLPPCPLIGQEDVRGHPQGTPQPKQHAQVLHQVWSTLAPHHPGIIVPT